MSSESGGKPANGETSPDQNKSEDEAKKAPITSAPPNTQPNAATFQSDSCKPNWDRIISIGTLGVLLLTFLAAIYAGYEADRLANLTNETVQDARKDQAAFIYFRNVSYMEEPYRRTFVTPANEDEFLVLFSGEWVNSGHEVPDRLKVWASCYFTSDRPDPSFAAARSKARSQELLVGPQSNVTRDICGESLGTAFWEKLHKSEFVIAAEARYWANHTPHRVEFCNVAIPVGSAIRHELRYRACNPRNAGYGHNCADDECTKG